MDNVCVADVATIGADFCFEAPVFAFFAFSVYEGLAGLTSAASIIGDKGLPADAFLHSFIENHVLIARGTTCCALLGVSAVFAVSAIINPAD
eukprot:CAMPEP_0182495610 /NCGR_PEP_ID=MMETSP1321-20130603/4380_1 /TAXON_ID=91990 /ORGANISM="Bolidomonas sp., Strain RCC1657" /LENGTH=91 /DNA_ID=CAMNT_0024699035 /DNA_START=687 /DNA_END=962 /DNA_ORIENTATION=-